MTPLIIIQLICAVFLPGALCDYRKIGLDLHNKFRKLHGCPPMRLSDELNEKADQCVKYYAAINKIDHTCPYKQNATYIHKGGNFTTAGENLFKGYGTADEAVKIAVEVFYKEIRYYKFWDPRWLYDAGHFLQMIWKKSTQLGIGYAPDKPNSTYPVYVVCLYVEHIGGGFQENVPPLINRGSSNLARGRVPLLNCFCILLLLSSTIFN